MNVKRLINLDDDYITNRLPKTKEEKITSIKLVERICAITFLTRRHGLLAVTVDNEATEISEILDNRSDEFFTLCLKMVVDGIWEDELSRIMTEHILEAEASDSRFFEMLITAEGLLHIRDHPEKTIPILSAYFGDECTYELSVLLEKVRSFSKLPLSDLSSNEYLPILQKHFDL